MTGSGFDLAAACRETPWADLVSPGAAAASGQGARGAALGPPELLAALTLGEGRWVAVIAGEPSVGDPSAGESSVGDPWVVPLVATAGGVRRARAGDGLAALLLQRLPELAELPSGAGSDGFSARDWTRALGARPDPAERGIDVDQTNESVIVGEQAICKWLLTASAHPHPSLPVLEQLHDSGFGGTPAPLGVLQWRGPGDATPRLVASIVTFLPGMSDGWTWAKDQLREAVIDGADTVVEPAARIGRLVADFHLAMRPTAEVVAPGPGPNEWRTDAPVELQHALTHTTGAARELLLEAGPRIEAYWRGLPERSRTVILGHGDLHVGQVLHDRADPEHYWLVDFDGNPVVEPELRTRKQPAALDVAGMAQSLSHVPWVVLRHEPELARSEVDRQRVVELGRRVVAAYLSAYRARLSEIGADDLLDVDLILGYRLRQVCREFSYAAVHLPRWSYVPEAALPQLMEELHPLEERT